MTRVGDIFEVKSEGKYRYFQFVTKDENWFNGGMTVQSSDYFV